MVAWTHDLAPFGVVTTDADLKIQFWNQWLEERSGRPATTVLGRSLFEVFPNLVTRGLESKFRRALAGEVSVLSTALHGYLLALPPTGRDTGYEQMQQTARIAPLRLGRNVVGTLSVIEDVTQRELQTNTLRRQHERARLLSWALARLLQSSDPLKELAEIFAQVALSLNFEAYLNHLVEPHGAMLRLHTAGGLLPSQRELLRLIPFGITLTGRCAEHKAAVLRNNLQTNTDPQSALGRTFGLRAMAAFPLLIGDRLLGTLSFGTSSRDVIVEDEVDLISRLAQYVSIAMDRALREETLRDAKEQLRDHAATLESKITERTATLQETIAQLESFSYTVAHDLRAPIRSLTSFSDLVLKDYGESIAPEGQFLLQRILRASRRLDALTRDLLKFSKVSRAELEPAKINLEELVQEIIELTPNLASAVTVHPGLGEVWGQPALLHQCFSNLFDNALKFAAPGRPLQIVVRTEITGTMPPLPVPGRGTAFSPARLHPAAADMAEAGEVTVPEGARLKSRPTRIWIEDNGIGIVPAAHEKIFGIFERVSGLENVEGTGIGLAIVARAMERMNGRCGVESELGKGSRFWLELPSTCAGAV